jgi:hypothetical protein
VHHGSDLLEHARVIGLVHMMIVPESGAADVLSLTVLTEPARRSGIERRSREVAQQRDRVALDEATIDGSFDGQDDDPQVPDDAARELFERSFILEQAFARNTKVSGGGARRGAVAPATNVQTVSLSNSITDDLSKDGSAVVTAELFGRPAVLSQPTPQGGSRRLRERMCADADDSRTRSGVSSGFRGIEKEVDAASRPTHPTVTIAQAARPTHPVFEIGEDLVKPPDVRESTHGRATSSSHPTRTLIVRTRNARRAAQFGA